MDDCQCAKITHIVILILYLSSVIPFGTGLLGVPKRADRTMSSQPQEHELQVEPELDVPSEENADETFRSLFIVTPSGEELPIQVVQSDPLFEIRSYLSDEPHTSIYTSYHFEHAGKAIKDEFSTLSSLAVQDGDQLKMVEDSYTDADARNHFRKLQHILSSNHSNATSTLDEISAEGVTYDGMKLDSSEPNRDTTQLASFFVKSAEPIKCLKHIAYSGFNPPPANRRLMGDFFYIEFAPLEEMPNAIIVANTRGFFVSQSKPGKFNPLAASKPCHSSTLFGCLSQYSAKFKKGFEDLLEQVAQTKMRELGPIAFPPVNWLSKPKVHELDTSRSELDLLKMAETDFLSKYQGRDWNEEFQMARQLPQTNLQERIVRTRTWYRVHAEFVEAATNGAVAIIQGQISPLNASEPPRTWLWIHNNIFYTQAHDSANAEGDADSDENFAKSFSNDIVGQKKFFEADPEDLFYVGSTLIFYCGKTILAQTMIPGLFNALVNGQHKVDYGVQEPIISAHPEFHSRIAKIAPMLYLKEHKVMSKKTTANLPKKQDASTESTEQAPVPVSLWTSSEVKGIVGTDNRYYLADFAHLMPRDANFATEATPHAVYRPELIANYLGKLYKKALFERVVEQKAAAASAAKKESSSSLEANGEAAPKVDSAASETNESNQSDSQEKSNLPQVEFPTIALNGDINIKDVVLADDAATIEKDKETNSTLAKFIVDECIPVLVREWTGDMNAPVDSRTLTAALHVRGINMRYLGKIVTATETFVPSIHDILLREMVVRSCKSIFVRLARSVPIYSFAEFVSSFLNAYFNKISSVNKGSRSGVKPAHLTEAQSQTQNANRDDEFGLSHHSLWVSIRQVVEKKYQFNLPEMITASLFDTATLRALCLKLGVKLESKNYDFNKDQVFEPSNVLEMVPITKHAAPSSSEANQLCLYAKNYIPAGKLEEAGDLLNEALAIYTQCFGPICPDSAKCHSSLSVIAYQMNDFESAFMLQERALQIAEATLGSDDFETAQAYGNLAHLAMKAGNASIALNYIRRSVYLVALATGWGHPELASSYSVFANLLQDNKEFKESLVPLQKAQKIIDHAIKEAKEKTGGNGSDLEIAILHNTLGIAAHISHLFAVAHGANNNFREALEFERKNYNLLSTMKADPLDPRMVESNAWLKQLTKKAVEQVKSTTTTVGGKPQGNVPLVGTTARLGGKKVIGKGVKATGIKARTTLDETKAKVETASSSSSSSSNAFKHTSTSNPSMIIGKGSGSAKFAAATAKRASGGKKTSAAPVPELI